MDGKEIFVSYAWGGESETIVNQIDKAFQEKGISIIRDKRDLGFKGLITDFMKQIGTGRAVVTVISDKYLKSPYCMFELLEIHRNLNFAERIFPVVLKDATIFDPIPRLSYLRHWREKKDELDNAIKEFGTDAITVIGDDYKVYKKVFDNFGEVVNILKDINALTPEMHTDDGFQTLIDAVSQRFTEDQTAQADSGHHSTTISNQTNVSGNGHIVVQGVSGTTINISTNTQPVNQNPPTSQPSSDSQQTSDLDPPGRNYKIANIVKLINSAYNDEELQNFCMINFDAVFSNFAATQNRTQKIMSLVDYCKRKLQFEQLLGFIRDENEAQYERNKPYY